ncbi:MAG TPA: hypothetical protein VJU59_01695 [Paraburkholderia sp.]|uniref:hypothetical protein n=1 Tax=Paraburkholderia sp. TaxID=1926495 RepID=UPI002B4A2154|nr:hypothetical protein [Paraburkholderia sp.]HKR38384.1 hypothetical protein [Paraburkholderia sp.]
MNAPEFFFTALDENCRPKGSRDPLGLEQIWSQVARQFVGNLTTVTRNLDNFIVALTGFAVAAQTGVPGAHNDARDALFYLRFERFEQLAAWARFRCQRPGVIGTRLLSARDGERGSGGVAVGAGAAARILGDQRRSGLWGLYSTALMGTGLIDSNRALTPKGREICAPFLACYEANEMSAYREAMSSPEKSVMVDPDSLQIAPLLDCTGRAELARRLLVEGGGEFQVELWDYAHRHSLKGIEGPQQLIGSLARGGEGVSDKLQAYASSVERLEHALVVVAAAFADLMGRRGKTLPEVVERFSAQKWGDREEWKTLDVSVPGRSFSRAWTTRVRQLADMLAALRDGRLTEFIEKLLAFHGHVMKERGGPAWVSFDTDGRIRVLMGNGRALKTPDDLSKSWDNDYFLGAFVSLWRQMPQMQ